MARRASLQAPPGSGVGAPRRHRRRRRRISRRLLYWIGGAAAAVVVLPLAVLGILIATIDPNTYRTQIEAAARQSLGRELRIDGPITVSASLSPTLVINDLTLANIPGGSRPEMVRVEQAEVELAPRALLTGRLVIARMALLRPDILLETNAAGQANWRFDRESAPTATPGGVAQVAAGSLPRLSLQTLHIRDGRITWRDGRTGRSVVFDIKRVSATAVSADSPVSLGAEVAIGRRTITLSAQTSPLGQLLDASEKAPWALFANLETSGAKLTVTGSLTHPLEGRGYSLRIDGTIPDLSQLSWLSPVRLPGLHDLDFSARVLDQGGKVPDISLVTIKTGLTNLDKISPGFTLDTARIEMPRLSEPVVVTAEGTYASLPMRVNATIGAPALLLPGGRPGVPFTVDFTTEIGGATFGVRGAIAAPAEMTGLDMAIGARVPDLAILSPLAGRRLPPLKTIAFSSRLVDAPGGYRNGVRFTDTVLTLPQADLAGEVTVGFGGGAGDAGKPGRPSVQAVLKSGRLDLDTLLALFSPAARADLDGLMPPPSDQPASVDVTVPLPPPPSANTVIPDTSLPLGVLDRGDADLRLTVGELDAGGNIARNVALHAVLNDGRLRLDQLTGDLPSGPMDASLDLDSRPANPPLALHLQLPGIDLKALLVSLGLNPFITGTAELHADLHAAGPSLHAMAASLDGHFGIAVTDADIDTALLGVALTDVLQVARLPGEAGTTGRTALRCIDMSFDAAHGVATLGPTLIDSARLLFNVSGKVNLADETLGLQLRPMLRTGGSGVVVPVRADGAFTDVKLALDSSGLNKSPFGLATGQLAGKGGGSAALASERGGDGCALALAAVRGAPSEAAATPARR